MNINDILGGLSFHRKGRLSSGAAFTEESFGAALKLTSADTFYPAGGKICVVATVAGNLELTLADGSTIVIQAPVGTSYHPLRVNMWNAALTTATATVYSLS